MNKVILWMVVLLSFLAGSAGPVFGQDAAKSKAMPWIPLLLLDDQNQTANLSGISYSLSFHPTSVYVQGENIQFYFTTYDGDRYSIPLHDESGGYIYFSQELKEVPLGSGSYKMDYFSVINGYVDDWGQIFLNIPYNDNNRNDIDDFCEKSMATNESITGSWFSGSAGSSSGKIIGSISRSKNNQNGTYNITARNTYAGDMKLSGDYFVGTVSGNINYSNSKKTIQMTYSVTLASPTPKATVNTTYKILDRNKIRINAVDFLPTIELKRDGNTYSSSVVLTDGESLTSWPDYQRWFLTITDTNDSDGDGIPDLSDSAQ